MAASATVPETPFLVSLPFRELQIEARAPSAPDCRCATIDAASLDHGAIHAEWERLARYASEPNPFGEGWFVRASLSACRPGAAVRIVGYYDNGRLRGIVPVEFSRLYYDRTIPHLRVWQHDNAFCGAPLVAAGYECRFWEAFLNWAGAATTGQCFVHIARISAEGPLIAALHSVVSGRNTPAAIVRREERAMLQSGCDARTYFERAMSGKKRKELRRQYRRLSELGNVRFVKQRDGSELPRWTEQFLQLEQAGWKGRNGGALACDPATERLFCEMLRRAADAARLERLLLSLDGRPIAMLVNFLTPPGSYSYKTTFDENFAQYSPGVLLQRENLDILDDPAISWMDSCAAPDHPMIERIWREKRTMVSVNVGLGGPVRRAAFRQMIRFEKSAEPFGSS